MQVQLKMLEDGESFELLESVTFKLDDAGAYSITVPAGFVTDLASIPAIAGVFGFSKLGKHSACAVLHDYLFRSGPDLGFSVANALFLESMRRSGVGVVKRSLMATAVEAFGRKNYMPIERRRKMEISDQGLDLIKSFEGYLKKQPDGSCVAYFCPAGVLTCGWGCTVGVNEHTHWTEQEATDALLGEIAKHVAAVNKLVKVPMTQAQADALISFSYNVGSGALAKSTLLRKFNAGDTVGAAAHFADWKKGGGRVLPGLVRRRAAEADLFLSDEPAPMAQQIDAPKSSMTQSRTGWSAGIAGATIFMTTLKEGMAVVADVTETATGAVSQVTAIGAPVATAKLLTPSLSLFIMGLGVIAIGACAFIWFERRKKMQEQG